MDLWIESHQDLWDHFKTKRLMRILGLNQYEAVGIIHRLWWWALDNASGPDGDLNRFSDADLADALYWNRGDPSAMVAAFQEAEFITADRLLYDWYSYAGKLIERRKADAERKRKADADAARKRASAGHPPDIRRTSAGESPESGRNRNSYQRTSTQPERTLPGPEKEEEEGASAASSAAPSPPSALPIWEELDAPQPVAACAPPSRAVVAVVPDTPVDPGVVAFAALLAGQPGWDPTAVELRKLGEIAAETGVDLELEGLKIVDHMRKPKRKATRVSFRFVADWFRREASNGRAAPNGRTNGRGPAPPVTPAAPPGTRESWVALYDRLHDRWSGKLKPGAVLTGRAYALSPGYAGLTIPTRDFAELLDAFEAKDGQRWDPNATEPFRAWHRGRVAAGASP